MNEATFVLNDEEYKSLMKIFKKYTNLYKILYSIDPAQSAEFLKKQEYYYSEIQKSKKEKINHEEHQHSHHGCNKLERKVFIPKESMNNVEKVLEEVTTSAYYKGNFEEMLDFFSDKFGKIVNSGRKDGLTLDENTEKELIHKFLLEGIPFYFTGKLKQKLKSYEESISEQPMLLAHPSSVIKKELLNFIDSNAVKYRYYLKIEK